MQACRSTSAILTALGNAPPTRTPTGYCGSTSPRALISPSTALTRSRPWRPPSMRGPARPSNGKRPQRRLTSCCSQPTHSPLRGPLESAQFTSFAFTTTLRDAGIRISMDGRGRWMDNVFIERLWRSLKYECVFLSAFETGSEASRGIGRWIGYYNAARPHSSFGGRTPDDVYATDSEQETLAA